MQNVYIHTQEEMMQESDYKNDHYIIIMQEYEVDCYYKQNDKIELIGIFASLNDTIQALSETQHFLA